MLIRTTLPVYLIPRQNKTHEFLLKYFNLRNFDVMTPFSQFIDIIEGKYITLRDTSKIFS